MSVKLEQGGLFFNDGSRFYKNIEKQEFFVYNCNHWSPLNGGSCCEWIVPEGTSTIVIELLSGGGPGGSSGGDYDHGIGGQGGNYTMKTLRKSNNNFNWGDSYTLCAGGTSDCSCCCSCNMNCRHGCKSFAIGPGLTNFCATGGSGGSTNWEIMNNCYNCHIGPTQCDVGVFNAGWVNIVCNCSTYGGDIQFKGSSGSMYKKYDCCADTYSVAGAPSGPFSAGHGVSGKHGCVGDLACCSANAAFPGGGGPGHQTASVNACWGGFGAGGLVKVTFS